METATETAIRIAFETGTETAFKNAMASGTVTERYDVITKHVGKIMDHTTSNLIAEWCVNNNKRFNSLLSYKKAKNTDMSPIFHLIFLEIIEHPSNEEEKRYSYVHNGISDLVNFEDGFVFYFNGIIDHLIKEELEEK